MGPSRFEFLNESGYLDALAIQNQLELRYLVLTP